MGESLVSVKKGVFGSVAVWLCFGCKPELKPVAPIMEKSASTVESENLFESTAIGNGFEGKPWIAHIDLVDLEQDRRPDLSFSNGGGFGPTPFPGARSWHGVQWLENTGAGNFEYRRIGSLPGAYSPVECDLDGDGYKDVIAASCFNDWFQPEHESLVWFHHDGNMGFTPHILAYEPTHLLTLGVADFDGSGKPWIVSGAFHAWPLYDKLSRLLIWKLIEAL